jgi:haloalkane dehalogenase
MIPTWIDKKEYPFIPKDINLPMGTMSYVDEGQGDPLVMVHGNPSWSFEFRTLIKHFSKTNRCIAPDHIGFGLSNKPLDWDYLPSHHAENLETLLQSMDLDPITLLVGDWGGPIGLSYAIHHPNRIKSIIITNTWLWSVKNDWYYRAFSGFVGGPIGRWLIREHNFFIKTINKFVYGDKNKYTPSVQHHLTMPMALLSERKGNWVFPKQIISASHWLASLWEQRNALDGKIKLFAWGLKDIAFREKELKYWLQHFPDVKAASYHDAGHFLAEEKPEELIREIEMLL